MPPDTNVPSQQGGNGTNFFIRVSQQLYFDVSLDQNIQKEIRTPNLKFHCEMRGTGYEMQYNCPSCYPNMNYNNGRYYTIDW